MQSDGLTKHRQSKWFSCPLEILGRPPRVETSEPCEPRSHGTDLPADLTGMEKPCKFLNEPPFFQPL